MKRFLGLTGALSAALVLGNISMPIYAYDASPQCYKNLQVSFFQERLTYEAFSLHGVPQGAWPVIWQDLDAYQKRVPAQIREIAATLRPDPFDPVFVPDVARKILIDVLVRTFSTVMRMHDLSNDADITGMFNFIMSKQIGKIDTCIPPPPKPHPSLVLPRPPAGPVLGPVPEGTKPVEEIPLPLPPRPVYPDRHDSGAMPTPGVPATLPAKEGAPHLVLPK